MRYVGGSLYFLLYNLAQWHGIPQIVEELSVTDVD